jgi:hypothetical protein
MRKMVLIVALICLVTLGVNHNLQAAGAWTLCTVTGTGVGPPTTYAYLKFTNAQQQVVTATATLDPNRSKELLAIALTAMASTQNVKAFFDPALVTVQNPYITVTWMYLSNEQQ